MKAYIQLCLLVVAISANAQGFVECLPQFNSPTVGNNDGTIGFAFRANADLTVTELGVFAYIFDNTGPINVAMWDGASNVLGSVTVSSSSTLYNMSRYEALQSSISLTATQIYFVGAYFPTLTGLNYAGGVLGGTYTVQPGIEILGLATSTNSILSRPSLVAGADGVVPAAVNFRSPEVPEPAAFSLLLLGGFALAASQRIRKS